MTAAARDVTALEVYDSTGTGGYAATAEFASDETAHVAYFAWSADGDRGDALEDWANEIRLGRVAADATSLEFALPAAANECIADSDGSFSARLFLATSDKNYDYLVVGTKSTTKSTTTANAAFLNTGLKFIGTRYAISCEASLNSATDTGLMLFGAMGQGTAKMGVAASVTSGRKWGFIYGNNSSANTISSFDITDLAISTARVVVTLETTLDSEGNSLPVGSVTVASTGERHEKSPSSATLLNTTSLCGLTLFGRGSNLDGSTISKYCPATIYGCVITDNGTPIRDFRPAVKDGVAGMWDAVYNKFYASAGGVALTAVGTNTTYFVAEGDAQVGASPAWSPAKFSTFVWTGGGGDALLTTDANWRGGVAPDLSDGSAMLVFGDDDGTASATVSGGISVYGISFSRSSAFSLDAEDSSAKIRLGAGGVSAANAAESGDVAFVLRVPVEFAYAPQAWSVATRTILDLHAPVSTVGFDGADFVVNSPGRVRFRVDNPDMTAPLVMNNTTPEYRPQIYALHTGLGPASRPATINGSIPMFMNETTGVPLTNSAPLRITKGGTGDNLYFEYSKWQNMHFLGEVQFLNASGATEFYTKAPVWFHGGLSSASGSLYPRFYNTTHVEKAVSLADTMQVDGASPIYLYEASSWGTLNPYKATIVCMGDYVLARNGTLNMGNAGVYFQTQTATLDLNGHPQRIGNYAKGWGTKEGGYTTVTSATPASLEVAGAANSVFAATVTGAAGFHFCGAGSFGFTNRTSTTTGELRVSSGTVNIWAGGGWTATTNVVVEGTGALAVKANAGDAAFGPEAGASACEMTVKGSGAVNVAEGESATVMFLYREKSGGELAPLSPGVYGGEDAGLDAKHTLPFLSGTGTLRVLKGPTGFRVVLR